MTIDPFFDPIEADVSTLIGQVDHLGVICLCALAAKYPQAIRGKRLAILINIDDRRYKLDPTLDRCQGHGYVTQTGSYPNESWHITDLGRQQLLKLVAGPIYQQLAASATGFHAPLLSGDNPVVPAEMPLFQDAPACKNFFHTLSSSSSSDQIRSDQIIEEEEGNDVENFSTSRSASPEQTGAVVRWLESHLVTGKKRTAVIDDLAASDWINVARLQAWLDECNHMKSKGFKFRVSPVIYAISCCLRHDDPPGSPAPDGVKIQNSIDSSDEARAAVHAAELELANINRQIAAVGSTASLLLDRKFAELELLKANVMLRRGKPS